MKDIRQTKAYAQHLNQLGWKIEKIKGIYCYLKKIPIIGFVVKVQRPEKLNKESIDKIENLRKKYRIFQLIIEPKTEKQARILKSRGYRLSKSPYLPTKTLLLDLTQSKKSLFQQLKKDAKYSLRKSEKVPLVFNPTITSFHRSWVKSVSLLRFVPKLKQLEILKKNFNHNALFLASHNLDAGAIFLSTNQITYYWQAFTSQSARKKLIQYQIVWQAINSAKTKKKKRFDFEGIFDPRFPTQSWKGFSHFKQAFGGQEKEYPGAYIKSIKMWGLI